MVAARRVEAANVSDRRVGARLLAGFLRIRTVMADAGYESRKLARELKRRHGWRLHITKRRRRAGRRIRDCASIICCSAQTWRRASAMPASIAGSATGPMQATTRRPGSSWIWAEEESSATEAQHSQAKLNRLDGVCEQHFD
jgi:hypothetical protein